MGEGGGREEVEEVRDDEHEEGEAVVRRGEEEWMIGWMGVSE